MFAYGVGIKVRETLERWLYSVWYALIPCASLCVSALLDGKKRNRVCLHSPQLKLPVSQVKSQVTTRKKQS